MNVEELHLPYVRRGIGVHRSIEDGQSPLGGSVSPDLADERERYEGEREAPADDP
jgi:hypothetical protein